MEGDSRGAEEDMRMIKIAILRKDEHIQKMNKYQSIKKVMESKLEGRRRVGRTKNLRMEYCRTSIFF